MSTPSRRHLSESLPQLGIEGSKAAPPQLAQQDGLINTSDWVREVYELHGMRLVFAVQGKPHRNAMGALVANGRHLVTAANEAGEALFLLNSLSKGRRAHMGLGLW